MSISAETHSDCRRVTQFLIVRLNLTSARERSCRAFPDGGARSFAERRANMVVGPISAN
jgi:hypothetical protein